MTEIDDRSPGSPLRVLIAGASGYLGRHLVRAIADAGHQVIAFVRDPARLDDVRDSISEVRVGDAVDPTTLHGVGDGADVVITTIGLRRYARGFTPRDVDLGANRNLLREAERAGVQRFVYISVFQCAGMERIAIVEAKRAFEQELTASPVSSTILRPNGFFSDMSAFLGMARTGCALVLGGGLLINPIDGRDVAAQATRLLLAGPDVVEIGGPDVMTHEQVARLAFDTIGRRPRIIRLPPGSARVALGVLRRLTPVSVNAPIEFLLTALSHDLVAPSSPGRSLREYFETENALRQATRRLDA